MNKTIQANELRIGNIVFENTYNMGKERFEGIPIVVNSTIIKTIELSPDLHGFSPIELTPEILEKAGFEKHGHAWNNGKGNSLHYCLEDYCLQIAVYGPTFTPIAFGVHYLHQLQNLYFALTGEELTISLT